MKEFEKELDFVYDEIGDAEKYARAALELKSTDPETAQLYARLSQEEMNHMTLLHQDIARRIEKYKRETGHQPSEAMQAIYDFTHRRSIAAAEKVADLQKMYR